MVPAGSRLTRGVPHSCSPFFIFKQLRLLAQGGGFPRSRSARSGESGSLFELLLCSMVSGWWRCSAAWGGGDRGCGSLPIAWAGRVHPAGPGAERFERSSRNRHPRGRTGQRAEAKGWRSGFALERPAATGMTAGGWPDPASGAGRQAQFTDHGVTKLFRVIRRVEGAFSSSTPAGRRFSRRCLGRPGVGHGLHCAQADGRLAELCVGANLGPLAGGPDPGSPPAAPALAPPAQSFFLTLSAPLTGSALPVLRRSRHAGARATSTAPGRPGWPRVADGANGIDVFGVLISPFFEQAITQPG